MDDKKGAYDKYSVTRNDGKPVGRVFVIEIDKDPQAVALLQHLAGVYRLTRPALSLDLMNMSAEIIASKRKGQIR